MSEEKSRLIQPWWKIWIASTTVMPAVAGVFGSMTGKVATLSLVFAMVSLVLHEMACKRLAPLSNGLHFFLMFGGGVLMASSVYSGCLVFRTHP